MLYGSSALQGLGKSRNIKKSHTLATARRSLRREMAQTIQGRAATTEVEQNTAIQQQVSETFSRLQNGSDVRGIALTGIEGENVNLSPVAAYYIGMAFAIWVSEKLDVKLDKLRLSIGRDCRLSGHSITASVCTGVASTGATISDLEMATTPAMFYTCIATGHKYDGAMMVTASHMPFNRNGIKFFTKDGGLDKPDVKAILSSAAKLCADDGLLAVDTLQEMGHIIYKAAKLNAGQIQKSGFLREYASFLRNLIVMNVTDAPDPEKPLDGHHIVVDAGNGAGGFIASEVLQPLGANIEGSQFLDPDGTFPNHMPNPEDKKAMQAACDMVKASGADMGIIFDTDVDRSAIVDKEGNPINANRMIALMAAITLSEHKGTTVVTDSVTSNGLTRFIEDLGGKHFRYRRGYRNVIGKGVELNNEGIDCALMIETSGHGALKENYFLDDGAYMAIKVVIEQARRRLAGKGTVTDLLANLKEPKEAEEFRLKLTGQEGKALSEVAPIKDDILEKFKAWIDAGCGGNPDWQLADQNHEGWRLTVPEGDGQEGWVLLRGSIHDPLCVLNVESEVEGGLKKSLEVFMKFIDENEFELDVSSVTKYMGK